MRRSLLMRRSLPGACAAALLFLAAAARAADTTPPVIVHTPVLHAPAQALKITALVTDESRVFPQIIFRRKTTGPFDFSVDMKPVAGVKDEYEATIAYKGPVIEYYLECYDDFGNGPARSGDSRAPYHVALGEERAPAEATLPVLPEEPAGAQAGSPEKAIAEPPLAPLTPEPAGARALDLTAPTRAPLTAREAALRSLALPGLGQWQTERKIRGVAFGAATGASLVAAILLAVRYQQASNIYDSAPLTVRRQAYDQARSYETSRNIAIGLTLGFWAANVAEAWLFNGTRDPW